MGCVYNLNDVTIDLGEKLGSALELIQALTKSGNGKPRLELNKVLIQGLNFYSSAQNNTIAILEANFKMKPGIATSSNNVITKLAQDIAKGTNPKFIDAESNAIMDDSEFGQRNKALQTFRQNLGVAIHECIEKSLLKEDIAKGNSLDTIRISVNNFVNKYAGVDLSKEENTAFKFALQFARCMKPLVDNADATGLIGYINGIINKDGNGILSQISKVSKKGYSFPPEMEMSVVTKEGKEIHGRADFISVDENGIVHIFDFKTTFTEHMGNMHRAARFAQLEIEKKIIQSYGVDPDKIQIHNITVKFQGDPEAYQITTSDPTEKVGSDVKANVDTRTYMYFPRAASKLDSTQVSAIEDEINRRSSSIQGSLGKGKINVEYQTKKLQSITKNNKTYVIQHLLEKGKSIKESTVIKWVQDGDNWIGYNSEQKEIIRDTIENIAKKEAETASDNLNAKTDRIATYLNFADYMGMSHFFRGGELEKKTSLLYALEPYMSPDFQYIEHPDLEKHNIITMYNKITHSYSFIVMSDLMRLDYSSNAGANLLAPYIKDPKIIKSIREFNELPNNSSQHTMTLQALFTILGYKDTIDNSGKIKIDKIQVVSASTGVSSSGTNTASFMKALHLLQYVAKNNADQMENADEFLDIYDKAKENIEFTPSQEILKQTVFNRISAFKSNPKNIDIGLDNFSSKNVEWTLDNVTKLLNQIKSEYGESYLNKDTEIGRIYKELQSLALTLKSDKVYDELYKSTVLGLSAAETLGSGIDLIRYGEIKKYSWNGMLIHGIAQGLGMSTTYTNPDDAIRYYDQAFREATTQITAETYDMAVEVNLATKKFLEASEASAIKTAVLGNTDSYYEALFEHDSDGKIAQTFTLQNPYGTNSLTNIQREYLEEILWQINRLRMKPSELTDEVRSLKYSEFKNNTAYQKEFDAYKSSVTINDQYRQAPLHLKVGAKGVISNIGSLFEQASTEDGIKNKAKKFFKKWGDQLFSTITDMMLAPEQQNQMDKDIDEKRQEFKYHSPYNVQGEHRVEILQNHTIGEWMTNLNILTLEYACAQFKEVYYQQVLKSVGDLIGQIELVEVSTGQDLSDTKEQLINRMKVSIYNKTLIKDEQKGIAIAAASLKQVVSLTKIASRYDLFIKEMILGQIRNVSAVWAKNIVNDTPITFSHLMKAAGVVYTNGLFAENAGKFDGETFGDFRLINALNNLYRINDRDLTHYGESVSFDHNGILNWGSRTLYLNTTGPDWYNRMMLLVAKMMADGTWEAHKIDPTTGGLVYDQRMDKRYKRFLDYYELHKNEEDWQKNEPQDEEYQKSKAMYTYRIQQFQKEGYSDLTAENAVDGFSKLPRCYTQQEMASFKEQVGVLYGFYSLEERTNVQRGISWLLHTQFLTFLPGELRKYLATGNFASSVGKTVHLVDNVTGEKLYYKTMEDGVTKKVTEKELDSNDVKVPVIEFTFVPQEGLMVSFIKASKDILTRNIDKNNPDRYRRAALFLHNTFLWLILHSLIVFLAYLGIDSSKSSQASALAQKGVDTMSRVAQEMNAFDTLFSPIASYGIAGYDAVKQGFGSVYSLITNDDYSALDAAESIFAGIKDMHLNAPGY